MNRKKWENITVQATTSVLQNVLTTHGESGWELVQAVAPDPGKFSSQYTLFFKRPKLGGE